MKIDIPEIIERIFGEQNLYKMDFWRDAGKPCRHNQKVHCDKCLDEIEREKNNESY